MAKSFSSFLSNFGKKRNPSRDNKRKRQRTHHLALCFEELEPRKVLNAGPIVAFQAEDFTFTGAPSGGNVYVINNGSDALGGSFITPEGDQSGSSPNSNSPRASYTVSLDEVATYHIWARLAFSNDEDSLFVSQGFGGLDGNLDPPSGWNRVNGISNVYSGNGDYQWVNLTLGPGDQAPGYTIGAAGDYEFSIARREGDLDIDAFAFVRNNLTPTQAELDALLEFPDNNAPTVVAPISDVTVDENAADTVIDLSGVFDDADGDSLSYSVTVDGSAAGGLFNQIAENYLDTIIASGRDTYGSVDSPLFAAQLHRDTLTLPTYSYDDDDEEYTSTSLSQLTIPGYEGRQDDRAWASANGGHHTQLYEALYRKSEETGDTTYADAADAALAYTFNNLRSNNTDLIAWGEEISWRLDTDEARIDLAEDDDLHEPLERIRASIWDRIHSQAPAGAKAYAQGLWDHQIDDQSTGDFSRHAGWSSHDTDIEASFPRVGGWMILAWAKAYEYNPGDASFRAEMLDAISTIENSYTSRRDGATGALPAGTGVDGDHPDRYSGASLAVGDSFWMFNNLRMALDVGEAAVALRAQGEDAVADDLEALAAATDTVITTRVDHNLDGHRVDDPVGFSLRSYYDRWEPGSGNTLLQAGDPREEGSTEGTFSTLWGAGYDSTTTSTIAVSMYERFLQTGLTAYRDMVLEAADLYLGEDPADAEVDGQAIDLHPVALATAIDLMVAAYEETGDQQYLDQANTFGQYAVANFFDGTSALPKVTEQLDWYEAITGGDDLIASLQNLGNATLLTASVSGSTLTLEYTAGQFGTSDVTVTANDGKNGTVSDTFTVTVNEVPGVNVAIQAEDFTFTGAPSGSNVFTINSDTDASGGSFITRQGDQGSSSPNDSSPRATYDVDLEEGTYHLWARVAFDGSGDTDSFFVSNGFGALDGNLDPPGDWDHINQINDAYPGSGVSVGDYQWINLSTEPGNVGPNYTVTTAGVHQFSIAGRENGLDIDGFAFIHTDQTLTTAELDTLLLGVPNDPPTVASPLADVTVDEDAADMVIDLSGIFDDPDDDSLSYSASSSDGSLVSVSVSGSDLTLSFGADQFGTADVTVTANDGNGGTVNDTFQVTVSGMPDDPIVVSPLANVTVGQDAPDQVINLSSVFDDVDEDSLIYTASSSDVSLVSTSVSGNNLTLSFGAGQLGTANVTVTADDGNGGTVDDVFQVTVSEVTIPENVAIQAEDFTFTGSPDGNNVFLVVGDSDASGGSFVHTESDTGGNSPENSSPRATYNINLQEGTYHLWARVAFDGSGNADSLFVSNGFGALDGDLDPPGGWDRINQINAVYPGSGISVGDYQWVNLSTEPGDDSPNYTVNTAGTHQFSIAGREDGLDLDGFAFVHTDQTLTTAELDALLLGTLNNAPTVASPIADVTVDENVADTVIDLSSVFNDADNDSLSYSASSTNSSLVSVSVSGSDLTLSFGADQFGTADVTVTADDGNGGTVSDTFLVTVNSTNVAPTVVSPIADVTVDEDAADTVIDLSGVFADADNDSLSYSASSSNGSLVSVSVSGSNLTLSFGADQFGTADVTVTADDGNGGTVDDVFQVNVNGMPDDPIVVSPLADVTVSQDASDQVIDLSNVFDDVDEDSLTYTASSSDNSLVSTSVSGSNLTLSFGAGQFGTANVTVTADDGNGGTVNDVFQVTVNEVTISENVAIQAEDFTFTGSPDGNNVFLVVGDSDASGGSFVHSESDPGGNPPSSSSPRATYEVNLQEGTYHLWARLAFNGQGNSDSLFVADDFGALDGNLDPPAGWDVINRINNVYPAPGVSAGDYQWVNLSTEPGNTSPDYTVTTAGVHQFSIAGRDDGMDLDGFAFVHSDQTLTTGRVGCTVVRDSQ